MEETFIVAVIITVSFCLSKFIERRYLGQEAKPLKDDVKESLIVMLCAVFGAYMYFNFQTTIRDFFNVVSETKILNTTTTQVFTDEPSF